MLDLSISVLVLFFIIVFLRKKMMFTLAYVDLCAFCVYIYSLLVSWWKEG